MKHILFFSLLAPLLGLAQQKKEFEFCKDVSWAQILAKAKTQCKYIFVFVASRGCKECQSLEKDIDANKRAMDFLRDEFISVEAELDTVQKESEEKSGLPIYQEKFRAAYITKTPTYLFFSPDGKLVHKGEKQISSDDLLELAGQALDPADQYYTLLKNYNSGQKDYPLLGYVALTASAFGDIETANTVAVDFKNNYLDHLPDSQLCRARNIDFIRRFYTLETTEGRFFRLCYTKPDFVNTEANKGFANDYVRYHIYHEEIEDKLYKDGKQVRKADWQALARAIQVKFGQKYVEQIIPVARRDFYAKIGDWPQYAEEVEEHIRKNPPKAGEGLGSDSWELNSSAWSVFRNCNDKPILEKALSWSVLSLSLDPTNIQYLDTRANLLYKLGRTSEAIDWEQKAMKLGIVSAERRGLNKGYFFDEFSKNIQKMRTGQPTWGVPASDATK